MPATDQDHQREDLPKCGYQAGALITGYAEAVNKFAKVYCLANKLIR